MLLKEKEELNRVNAALQKQLNEQKGTFLTKNLYIISVTASCEPHLMVFLLGKGSEGGVTIDQALKEKKEKDTRIQV